MIEPLRFQLSDLEKELDLMMHLASGFLEEDATNVLCRVKEQIEILKFSEHENEIKVDVDRPIRTKPCNGGYERNDGGARKDLYGELLFKWQLKPIGRAQKKYASRRQVEVVGIASSVARLKINDHGCDVVIASWRMEFGDGASPGSFFHAQIPDTIGRSDVNDDSEGARMWPSWLPVPRLPIPTMTPMLALELVISEIFGDNWSNHLISGGYQVDNWGVLQQRRYVSYLNWLRILVDSSGEGSPISAIKSGKPNPDIFVFQ